MERLENLVFKTLLDAAPDAILIVDADGRILVANAQVERLFGYAREELLGQSVDVLVPVRQRRRHGSHRRAYEASPSSRPMGIGMELAGLCKDGIEVPVEISLSPVHIGTDTVTFAAVRDISERKQLERERDALRMAVERDEERQRIGMDLHDGVMQDIYAVGLTLEMALADLQEQPEVAEESVSQAIDRLHDVVRDIRSYIFDLRPRRLAGDLSAALANLGREFQDNTSIRTLVEAPSLAALPEETATAVYHITHEALSNVRRHAAADQVHVLLSNDGGAVLIEVRDNGRGFSPAARPDESHRGLQNMTARARAVQGEVEIDSAPGRGTCVRARFQIDGHGA